MEKLRWLLRNIVLRGLGKCVCIDFAFLGELSYDGHVNLGC